MRLPNLIIKDPNNFTNHHKALIQILTSFVSVNLSLLHQMATRSYSYVVSNDPVANFKCLLAADSCAVTLDTNSRKYNDLDIPYIS